MITSNEAEHVNDLLEGPVPTDRHVRMIAQLVQDRYGFHATGLTRLGGELDINFKVTGAAGEARFVRLTPKSLGDSAIRWQNAVLEQLARSPISVATPRLIRQLSGDLQSEHVIDGLPLIMRMTTWVPGETVSELGRTDQQLRRHIGQLAAELIDSLAPLNALQNDEYLHHWMVVRSGDSLRETMAAVRDPHRRQLIGQALREFERVESRISELPRTVVHQDLHDFNVLAHTGADRVTRISGIVDFNDAVYTARIAEVAVAAAYAGLRQDDPFSAFCDVIEGFVSRQSLSNLELEMLYPLAVARLAVNGSTWTARAQHGNSEYAHSRMAATWPALEQLLEVTPDEATRVFRSIRSGGVTPDAATS